MAEGLLWFREKQGRDKGGKSHSGYSVLGACLGEKVVQKVPFENTWQSKMAPKSSKLRQGLQTSRFFYYPFSPGFGVCFSRNHSNPRAFWTYCFEKHHFFDDDWLLFRFFCFSLCYVLYVIFITFVEKTSVNAQPLSPPILEKIAPDFKNIVFFLFCIFTFAFCILFHIFVNFRLPLPTLLEMTGSRIIFRALQRIVTFLFDVSLTCLSYVARVKDLIWPYQSLNWFLHSISCLFTRLFLPSISCLFTRLMLINTCRSYW